MNVLTRSGMNVLTRSGMIVYSSQLKIIHQLWRHRDTLPYPIVGTVETAAEGGNGGSDDFDRTNVNDVVDNIDRATYIGFHT